MGALITSTALLATGPAPNAAAVTTGSSLFGWGANANGNLGDGTLTNQLTPEAIILAPGVTPTAISAGVEASLAIGTDGNLYAWGNNVSGDLGDGTTTEHLRPEEITLAHGVKPTAITAGYYDAFAIGTDGNLYAWGEDNRGQLGDGTDNTQGASQLTPEVITLAPGVKPAAIATNADNPVGLAIGSDGNVYAWGDDTFGIGTDAPSPEVVTTIGDTPFSATAISVGGDENYMAIGSDGHLYTWGFDETGTLGDGTSGQFFQPTPEPITLASGVTPTAISLGGEDAAAIGSDGQLYSWGEPYTGNGTSNSQFVPQAISLAPGVTPTAISEGFQTAMAIGSDGQIYEWGQSNIYPIQPSPVPTPLATGVTATVIAAGFDTSLAIGTGPSSTVTFNANGGSGTMATESEIAPVALTTNAFTRAGYTFSGWNTAADGSGTAYADGATYAFGASATLYAQWSANATDDYSYAANGGSGTAPASGSGLDGTKITLATNTFTNPGFTFAGWNDGTTTYAAGATYTLSSGGGAITFAAQWTANATDTVTFNAEGGSAVSPKSGPDGTTITLPSTPTRAGYTFDGWFAAPSGGSALTSPYTLTGSVTLYAQWAGAPTTSVLVPSAGATLTGSTYLDASATNATSVKFLLFGGTFGYSAPVICTATATPYGWVCSWNTSTVPNGAYTLISEATGAGGSTFSAGVNITVKNSLPTTAVLIPSNGATLSGSTYLDASASNATSVEFLLFGGSYGYSAHVACTATTSTAYGWLCAWNTTTVPNGSYTLLSEAFNSAGSTLSSSGVRITVKN